MLHIGLVMKSTGSWYTVKCGEKYLECKVKGKLRYTGIKTTNPIAVGDKVEVETTNNYHVINNILPRKNYIIRKSTNLSRQAHILASNLDYCYLIVTMIHPEINLPFIDRFLVSAEAYNIPTCIVFNKSDLYDSETYHKLESIIQLYSKIGYTCHITSTITGLGVNDLQTKMKGKINLLTGNSGVGKSSLINCIDSSLSLRTSEISDYHLMGKHTTTFYEMFEIENGGYIIDSPGIKGFGVVEMEDDPISHYFPEMLRVLNQCKFNNCTHNNEPGCAIKAAVESGEIAKSRYESYLKILSGDEEKYR